MKVSLIIPTYNEAENIIATLDAVFDVFEKNIIDGEVMVIDDNSPDGTADIVRSDGRAVLYRNGNKSGIGKAHWIGYSQCKGDIIIGMDADMSHNPKVIPKMIKTIESGYDMVIGSRYMRDGCVKDKSKINIAASKVANGIARNVLGIPLHDFTNGYRAFRRVVFYKIKDREYSSGNVFLMEFICYASMNGFRISEVPVTFVERKLGVTKTKLWKETKAFLKSVMRLGFARL